MTGITEMQRVNKTQCLQASKAIVLTLASEYGILRLDDCPSTQLGKQSL